METIFRTGFFAYGSDYKHVGEFIENAIKKINSSDRGVSIESWKKLEINGVFIISEVLKKINESDFFCADITGMNDNVLFEIGFAIAKKKPLWLTHDVSIYASVNRFKELNFLTGIGYQAYTNSDGLVEAFFKEMDGILSKNLFDSLFSFIDPKPKDKIFLYLKSQFQTDYNKYVVNLFNTLGFSYLEDDPHEVKVQSLSWYLENIIATPAILLELSATNRSGFEIQNSKCAFLAGISYGLGLDTLMIAQEPYDTPLDYKELLTKFWDLTSLKKAVDPFIYGVRDRLPRLISVNRKVLSTARSINKLQKIKFGESVAEHESDIIFDYYVDTAHQQNLLKNEYNIVVGRKGTGKTATLYYLYEKLARNVRNHVCLIKPVNFELDGLMSIFSALSDESERGAITETIWKFLIYTEIGKEIFENIKDKPEYALEDYEISMIDFIRRHEKIFSSDFSSRLEEQLITFSHSTSSQENVKKKFAEVFHQDLIGKLRPHIIQCLSKKERLVVLIDNLDKSWRKESNIHLISKFLLGLLGVVGRIAKDFRTSNKNPNIKFQFNLTIFLRSDIFKFIQKNAREPDKLEFTKLVWSDEEIFLRLINERIDILNADEKIDSNMFWNSLITSTVDGVSTKKFIFGNVIPRPRDIIFFFNTVKNIATSRGHSQIDGSDLKKALSEYSNWVFKSIIVENGITMEQMETFLFNLLGEKQILQKEQVVSFMKESNLDTDAEFINYFLDRLVSLTLLGRETKPDYFEFVYDFESDEKNKMLAKKLGSERFKIHNAFCPFLECIP